MSYLIYIRLKKCKPSNVERWYILIQPRHWFKGFLGARAMWRRDGQVGLLSKVGAEEQKKQPAAAQIMHKADLFSLKFGDICINVLKPLFNQKMNENHHKSTHLYPSQRCKKQRKNKVTSSWNESLGVRPCWKSWVARYNDINDPVTGFHVA